MPSATTRAESPPGPSVIEVSTWMAISRPSDVRWPRPLAVATNRVEAEGAQAALELAGREVGQQHRRRAVDVVGEERLVEVVAVEVGDVEVVGPLDPGRGGRRRAGRCGGTRTTSRRTPARTTGRTGSSRARSRSGCRRGRSTWRARPRCCQSGSGAERQAGTRATGPAPVRRRAGRCTSGPGCDTCSVHFSPSQ